EQAKRECEQWQAETLDIDSAEQRRVDTGWLRLAIVDQQRQFGSGACGRIEADQNTSLNDECRYTRRPLAGHARVPIQILQRLLIIVDSAHPHLPSRPLARDCRQIFFRGGAMRTILANENFERSLTRRRSRRESTCSEKNQRNEQPHQMRLLKA